MPSDAEAPSGSPAASQRPVVDDVASPRKAVVAALPPSQEQSVKISAVVVNSPGAHEATVRSGTSSHALAIAPKASGGGSATNGGELLMLALATCYCNDLYREAGRLGIELAQVTVEATADFNGVGLAATNVRYRASVKSSAAPDAVARLLRETDAVAEVHNTLRQGVAVQLMAP